MNFIDKAIEQKLRGDDFLQEMAKIYDYPEVWEVLDNYPVWIRDIITIIDYDTELQMEGLDTKDYSDIVKSLKRCKLDNEAQLLAQIDENSSDDDLSGIYDKLALNNDYDSFWSSIISYIDYCIDN